MRFLENRCEGRKNKSGFQRLLDYRVNKLVKIF